MKLGNTWRTRHRRAVTTLLIPLIFTTFHLAPATTFYNMLTDSENTVTEPPVMLQSGTAGSSTIYTNNTSASVTVSASATTFHPNGYSVVAGSYGSGSTPSSVSAVDSNYFVVDSVGSGTSDSSYHPLTYNLVGGTGYVSGSVDNLTSDDDIYMTFQSYLTQETNIEDAADSDLSDVDQSSDKGSHSNFSAEQSGPDASYDVLTESMTVSNWWDMSYLYRRRLNITTTPALPAGYSVSFTLDTTGAGFQDDGDDLRVVYWNGTGYEELDRANETSFNDANTEIWFATVSQIPSGGYDDNYYVYYGNPSALNPPANRSNVYLWWDDFSSNTLSRYDLAKWVDIHGADTYYATPTYDAANERVTFDTGDNYASDMYPKGINVSDALICVTFWADLNYPTDATIALISRLNNPGIGSTHYYYHFSHGSYTSPGGSYNSWTNGERNTLMYSPPSNTYWVFNQVHNLTYAAYGTSHKLWFDEKPDDTPLASATHSGDTSPGRWGWAPAQVRGWVDDLLIRRYVEPEPTVSVGAQESQNYELDLEVQWTNVDFSEANEVLCIYGGAMGSEDIRVDVWYSNAWSNVFIDLSAGWNNVSVGQYLTSSTLTIRFKGGVETSDTVQDTWQVDVSLLHVWTREYTAEVEFQGGSNLYDWTRLNWTAVTSWTVDSVQVTLQLYNYTGQFYPGSGDGYISYTSGTANADQTGNQIVTSNPEDFRNATGGWKMKLKGVKLTDTQFDLKVDLVETASTYYSEYTASTEFLFDDITDNQSPSLNFTVVSHNSADGASVTIQVWNYTTSSYVTGGQGYVSYASTGGNVTKYLNITINPSSCLNGPNARIKITSVHSATVPFQQYVNYVRLLQKPKQLSYDYVLNIQNQVADPWKVRLKTFSQTSLGRLLNCTIYFKNGTQQIVVLDGFYSQDTGGWADLAGSGSIHIAVDVSAEFLGTSQIWVYLEVLKPSTTTRMSLVILFRID